MKLSTLKGYVFVVATGLVGLAAAVLVVLQWGNKADFTAYGPHVEVNTALLMLLSAAGGLVGLFVAKAFIIGVRSIGRGRRQQARQQAEKRLDALEKARREPRGGEK